MDISLQWLICLFLFLPECIRRAARMCRESKEAPLYGQIANVQHYFAHSLMYLKSGTVGKQRKQKGKIAHQE